LSEPISDDRLPSTVLVDADVFFSYLVSDEFSGNSERLLERADKGVVKLRAASEIYDDIICALRSDNKGLDTVKELLEDLRKFPHETLPTTLDIASEALAIYTRFGGPRRLHYFDSFHVATAKAYELSMVTSDKFILQNSQELELITLDLRSL
jgi:predicted nucleic acid-binding protein